MSKIHYLNDLLEPTKIGVFYNERTKTPVSGVFATTERFKVFENNREGAAEARAFAAEVGGKGRPIIQLPNYNVAERDVLMRKGRLIGHDGEHWYAECKTAVQSPAGPGILEGIGHGGQS